MRPQKRVSRRGFLKCSGAAVMGGGSLHGATAQGATQWPKQELGIREYRTLGRTGFKVSDVSMGCGSIAESNVVRYAYDHGINYFDTAESYGNGEHEKVIGGAMEHMDRAKIFITTKLHFPEETTREQIVDRQLQIDSAPTGTDQDPVWRSASRRLRGRRLPRRGRRRGRPGSSRAPPSRLVRIRAAASTGI